MRFSVVDEQRCRDLFSGVRKDRLRKAMAVMAVYAAGVIGAFLIGLIFFQSSAAAGIVSMAGLFYPRYRAKQTERGRKREMTLQFKDALYMLAASLGAGRSLEQSFRAALEDLAILYPENSPIISEFTIICRRLDMNEPIERLLAEFAKRTELEDIRQFAEVISVSKKAGGNMVKVMKNSSILIGEKIEMEQEIETILAKPRLERRILMVMPVVFIGMMNVSSDYTAQLFQSAAGYGYMLAALLLIAAAFFASQKIMRIEV